MSGQKHKGMLSRAKTVNIDTRNETGKRLLVIDSLGPDNTFLLGAQSSRIKEVVFMLKGHLARIFLS